MLGQSTSAHDADNDGARVDHELSDHNVGSRQPEFYLDSAHESLVETSRQESIRPSLLSGVLGAAHGRPETVRKHAEGTRTFDQGAVEATG